MITAFYIEDGLEQVILTPENDHEKRVLALLHDKTRTLEIKSGSFYECRGGWKRYRISDIIYNPYSLELNKRDDDESTMLVLRRPVAALEDQGAAQ